MSAVKVAGCGWAEPEGERVSHGELLYRATRRALDSAGLTRDAITSAVTTSYDYVEGRNLSNQFTLDSIGGTMKPCDLRLSDDGIHSIAAGCAEALAEPGGVVVVGAVQLGASEGLQDTIRAVEETFYEPLYLRPVLAGSSHPEAFAFGLIARAYLQRHGVADAGLAELVSRRSGAGEHARSAQEILESPTIAGPLHEAHVAPRGDAAAVLLLCTDPPSAPLASVRGVGWGADDGMLPKRELHSQVPTAEAARRAYEAAGVKDPAAELERVEVYNAYGIDEVLACEALGLAKPGAGLRALLDTSCRVNPTGGVQAMGWARGAASLLQTAKALQELADRPGALFGVQGWCGCGASSSALALFEMAG